ncbi:MAG: XdhC family protein [Candidatus Omnitrophica bacterium]|nr:XdhC family protein [Candidatus Omnitrophota bacterium]
MNQDFINHARLAIKAGRRCAFATVVESTVKGTPRKAGAKMIVFEDGSTHGTIGGGRNEKDVIARCLEAIGKSETRLMTYDYFGRKGESVCGGQIRIFIEPLIQVRKFILVGAGHIALPLSLIVKSLDYHLTIIDSRRAFANPQRMPWADRILVGKPTAQLKKCRIDGLTDIMIVTHGNEHDYEALQAVICTPEIGYLGCISSQAKRVKFFRRLREDGVAEKYLRRISIPAGLDLGAQTPAEIAVSIAAELIRRNNPDATGTDKFRTKDLKG